MNLCSTKISENVRGLVTEFAINGTSVDVSGLPGKEVVGHLWYSSKLKRTAFVIDAEEYKGVLIPARYTEYVSSEVDEKYKDVSPVQITIGDDRVSEVSAVLDDYMNGQQDAPLERHPLFELAKIDRR
jgi:hypothetical protein